MAEIRVREDGAERFAVEAEGRSFVVTVPPDVVERYAPGAAAEELVRASFRFLLDREPAGSILRRFDLPVIERYFPEYSEEIGRYLADD
jgi:hypothetical protein